MLKFLFSATLFVLFTSAVFAQNGQYDLRFSVDDCVANQVFVDIEIKSNSAANIFELADQNYRMSFNREAVDDPFIAEELDVSGFIQTPTGSAFYGSHNINGSSDTIISYNVELLSNNGIELSATDWTSVGRIGFDILDPNECLEIKWHQGGIFPPIFIGQMFNGGLSAAAEGIIEDLNVCFADLNCGGSEPPVATDDEAQTNAGIALTFNIINNDVAPADETLDVNSLSLQSTIPTTQGTLINNGNGTVTFTPAAGFVGAVDPVNYEICASNGLCDEASISITVVGESPMANNDFITAAAGQATTFSLVNNDTAPAGESLNNSSVQILGTVPANQGMLTNNGDGTITFTPAAGFIGGVNTVTYEVCATNGLCDQAFITINVLAEAPSVNDDEIIVYQNTALTFSVVANDVAPAGSSLNNASVNLLTAVPNPQGSLSNNGDGTLSFTPSIGFTGDVQPIEYEVCASNGLCGEATIFITVYAAPTAGSDFVNAVQDEITIFSVINNDSPPAGGTIDISSVSLLSNIPVNEGGLTNNGDGTFTFIPALGFYGGVTPATYQVCTDVGACAQAIIAITVLQKPTALNDTVVTDDFITIDILSNDIAPVGSSFNPGTIVLLNAIPNTQGILVNSFNGTIIFAPAAGFVGEVDPINYSVCAANGTCDEATIYITVFAAEEVGLSGTIFNRDGVSPIADVSIQLSGTDTQDVLTLADGNYVFENLTSGGDYTVTPVKEGLITNGVTSVDLAIAQAHILDLINLDVYGVIAMDANESCALSSVDLAITQGVILGLLPAFPHGKNWRFVPADLTFPDPNAPCDYEEFLDYEMLETMLPGQDFIGVKAGDANSTYNPAGGFAAGASLYFSIADHQATVGEVLSIPITASGINDILTWQLTHSWDANILEFQGATALHPAIEQGFVFNEVLAEPGYLTSLWLNSVNQPLTLDDNTVLYELEFKVIGEVGMSSDISTNSLVTPRLAYRSNYEQVEFLSDNGLLEIVSLTDIEFVVEEKGAKLLQNTPNPFTEQTTINFYLPHSGRASVLIYNMLGEKIWQVENNFAAGNQSLIWAEANHYPAGIYTCKLQFEASMSSIKMLNVK